MSTISNNIKNFRLYRNLSQREVADKLHKTSAVISNWEKGINSPDLDSLEKLCLIFDCSPNEMFGWEENEGLNNYLDRKKEILTEMNRLIKARDSINMQLQTYYKQLDGLPPIDYEVDENTEDLELPVKRRSNIIRKPSEDS